MAVDQALIQGAYAANAPVRPAGAAIQEATKSITDSVNEYMRFEKAKSDKEELEKEKLDVEFQKQIDIAANANDLGPKERERFTKQFVEASKKYSDPNTTIQERSEMIANIGFEADFTKRAFDIYKTMGLNADGEGDINSYWIKGKGKDWVKAAVDPNISLEKNEEGSYGWKVNGEFKTLDDFEREIAKHKKDDTFAKGILAINEDSKKRSAKNTDKRFTKFNVANTKQKVDLLLNSESANLISIATDPMLGSTESFQDHVTQALVGRKYESLIGGDYELDADNDGIIDEDEAKNIFEYLLDPNNEEDLKAELSAYFTEVVERQGWNVGAGDRVTTIEEPKGKFTQEDLNRLIEEMIKDGTLSQAPKPTGQMRGGDGSKVPIGSRVETDADGNPV